VADEKSIEIRWSDLDPYGHVNQAVYLTYAEEAIDHWLRRRLDAQLDYVAARAAIDYRSELRLADGPARARVRLLRAGTKSITLAVEILAADGRLAAEVETVSVAIDGEGGASRALTDAERAALAA
jgi:acyl-CoA thioester hydrolase